MKFAIRICLVTLGCFGFVTCPGAEALGNLIMNGAFEAGNQFWRGDGKVATLPDGNKVYEIEATANKSRMMSQDFKFHNLKEVQIVFKARGLKYKGKGLRIGVHRPGGGVVFYDRELPEDGSWKDFHVKYTQSKAEDQRKLTISVHEGSGTVQIDDVEVREPVDVVQNDPPKPEMVKPKPGPVAPPAPTPVVKEAPPVSKPLPAGDITSLEQVVDSAPQLALAKFRDPATQEQGVSEMNDYFASQVKGKHVRMRVTVEKAADFDGGGAKKYYRIKVPDNAIGKNEAGLKLLWFFVYIPKENMLDASATVPAGAQITVSGDLTRCDLKNVGGWRLNANISSARIEP